MDDVFRALADPTRRTLLDELFERDGQSLTALERPLSMTRFGVMKHLKVLEEAGLVVTEAARPREAALPEPRPDPARPRQMGEQVRRPRVAALSELKHRLEKTMEKVYEIYIKTTPERLWEAITEPELRAKYNFGVRVNSDWTPGSSYQGISPAAPAPLMEGENLDVDPPRRLVQSFTALWSDEVRSEGASGSPGRSSRSATPAG